MIIDDIGRVAVSRGLNSAMSWFCNDRFAIRALEIRVRATDASVTISVRYDITCPSGKMWRWTAFDTSALPVRITSVFSNGSYPIGDVGGKRGRRMPPLILLPGDSRQELEVTVECLWRPCASVNGKHNGDSRCIVVPDLLPRFCDSRKDLGAGLARIQPEIDVCNESADVLQVDTAVAQEGRLLQASLLVGGEVHKFGRNGQVVVVSSDLAELVDIHGVRVITGMMVECADYFGSKMQAPYSGAMVLLKQSDLASVRVIPPGIVALSGLDEAIHPVFGTPRYDVIAAQVASLWWGVGCRISGRGGREIETGLRYGMMLAWLHEIGNPVDLEFTLRWCRHLATPGVHMMIKDYARGHVTTRRFMRIALWLFERFNRDPTTWFKLGALTRQCWGQYVPVWVVREALEIPSRI